MHNMTKNMQDKFAKYNIQYVIYAKYNMKYVKYDNI